MKFCLGTKKILKKIKNKLINKYQQTIYGYTDIEIYNLNSAISEFILPRLIVFSYNYTGSKPSDLSSEQWRHALDDMIYAFENFDDLSETIDSYRIDRGFMYFGKYFRSLWF